jgi:hypothetical protein
MAESQLITAWGSQFLKGLFRHCRQTFFLAGQDSFTEPPSQSPDSFELLTNVLPTLRGSLQRRWGYQTFKAQPNFSSATPSLGLVTFGVFQDDTLITRRLIVSATGNVYPLNEDGTVFASTIFQPTGAPCRMLSSRSYTYFSTGTAVDLLKWNGSGITNSGVNAGVSKWGIDATNTIVAAIGPNVPTAAASVSASTGGGGGGPIILPPIDPDPINPIKPINPPNLAT